MEEAELAQDEERDRRKQRSVKRNLGSSSVSNFSGGDRGSLVLGKTSHSHHKTTARFPLIVARTVGKLGDEEGYETDHQDYCEVCQQVGCSFLI